MALNQADKELIEFAAHVIRENYDKIISEDHLKIAGNQLLDFVLNYEAEDDSYNGNSVGYGIAPICVVLPSLIFYIVNTLYTILFHSH